jgi:hypothetical protein
MRWAGHVASMVEKKNAYRILVRKSEGKRSLGRYSGAWVNNIKKGKLKKSFERARIGLICHRIRTSGRRCCVRGDEPSTCIKCGDFLD